MTTHYAAIDTGNLSGTVYGVGSSKARAVRDALRWAGPHGEGDRPTYRIVPCTPAAAKYVREHGGAPSEHLTVTARDGVCLRSEEG